MSEAELYESGRYAERNPDWHVEDAAHKAAMLHEVFQELGLRPRSVVDVGCGPGAVLAGLKQHLDRAGHEHCVFEGWDIAPLPISRAAEREEGRLRFVVGDVLASDQRWDLVLCLDTFEHVGDDVGFLQTLRERGDAFLFRIPLDLSVWDAARPGRLLAAREQWGHRHAYNRVLALHVLEEAGFSVRYERYDRVPPSLMRSRQRWMDGLRRALYRISPHRAVALLGGWSLVVYAEPRIYSSGGGGGSTTSVGAAGSSGSPEASASSSE